MSAEAARVALGYFRSDALSVRRKPDRTLVTEADLAVETLVRKALAEARPYDGVIGEEEGARGEGRPWRWLLDPIDGTHNFARGVPIWAVLLALVDGEDAPVLGVVSAPALGSTWWASRGGGAYRDGTPISVSSTDRLAEAFLSVTLPEDPGSRGLAALWRLLENGWRIRGLGDFWQHCLVAEGALDGCVDSVDLHAYDLAAVRVVVEEAGGTFTDHEGRLTHDSGSAVSSNGLLHAELLDLLRNGTAGPTGGSRTGTR